MTGGIDIFRFGYNRGLLATLATLTALAACGVVGGQDAPIQKGQIIGGATKQITDVQPVSGFLPQPELLAPGGAGRAALVYINTDVDLSRYSKVLLDRVEIWAAPDSELASLPQDQREALVNRFQAALTKSLIQHCRLARTPSAGTVRLRIALTDVKKTNAAVNTVATYAPYVSTAVSLASLGFNNGVGYFAGTASVEGYVTDAKSGKLLWEAVDKRGGTGALVQNTLNTWLDVDHAFEAWSEKIASRLQEVGVCNTPT